MTEATIDATESTDSSETSEDVDTALEFQDAEQDTENDSTEESSDADSSKEGESDEDGEADSGELEYSAEDFEMPEGMEVDENLMGGFMGIAKEMKLTKDQSQKLVSLYAENQRSATDAVHEAWEGTRQEWQSEIKADKEIGGKKYAESKAVMLSALQKYGSKELVEFGNQFGWSDNPEYQRFLFRIGKTLKEDSHEAGKAGPESASIADRWYKGSDKE